MKASALRARLRDKDRLRPTFFAVLALPLHGLRLILCNGPSSPPPSLSFRFVQHRTSPQQANLHKQPRIPPFFSALLSVSQNPLECPSRLFQRNELQSFPGNFYLGATLMSAGEFRGTAPLSTVVRAGNLLVDPLSPPLVSLGLTRLGLF